MSKQVKFHFHIEERSSAVLRFIDSRKKFIYMGSIPSAR